MDNYKDNVTYNADDNSITIKKEVVARILEAETAEKAVFLVEDLKRQILEKRDEGLIIKYLKDLARKTTRIVPPEEFIERYRKVKNGK